MILTLPFNKAKIHRTYKKIIVNWKDSLAFFYILPKMISRKIISELQVLNGIGKSIIPPLAVYPSRSYSSRKDLEKVTHTGQVFTEDDYRNVRFTNAKRYVNENWGIKLIDEIPPKECTERVVYCDGGDGALGHPKVYINLDKPGGHICGYCGLRFIKKDNH